MPRLLLGPGPSPVSTRVMDAMTRPSLSHLDPDFVPMLDDVRARLARVFMAGDDWFCPAISGTGTTAMEAAIANLVTPGMRATAVVNGYFGDRLAQMLERFGASVQRVEGEWGRAIDPAVIERALAQHCELVTIVHAETTTGALNPLDDIAPLLRARGIPFIVDAVTSLGAAPVKVAEWGAAAVYSCSQKGLGAPSGLGAIAWNPAFDRDTRRSFALDRALLRGFWVDRRYHHTISAPMIYALREALAQVEEETLAARWQRHVDVHRAFVAGLATMGIGLLPPPDERIPSLNAVLIPDGIDDATVRKALLARHDIEIGGGLGPLAGRIWRVGLMGHGATHENVAILLDAIDDVLGSMGYPLERGAARKAAEEN